MGGMKKEAEILNERLELLLKTKHEFGLDDYHAVGNIFSYVDALLENGKFEALGEVYDEMQIERFPSEWLIGLLSVTSPWKKYISFFRDRFWERVYNELVGRIGEERTETIMKGLKSDK